MAREEITRKIEEIETRRFYLAMKDRWTREDFRIDSELSKEYVNLKKELEKVA